MRSSSAYSASSCSRNLTRSKRISNCIGDHHLGVFHSNVMGVSNMSGLWWKIPWKNGWWLGGTPISGNSHFLIVFTQNLDIASGISNQCLYIVCLFFGHRREAFASVNTASSVPLWFLGLCKHKLQEMFALGLVLYNAGTLGISWFVNYRIDLQQTSVVLLVSSKLATLVSPWPAQRRKVT